MLAIAAIDMLLPDGMDNEAFLSRLVDGKALSDDGFRKWMEDNGHKNLLDSYESSIKRVMNNNYWLKNGGQNLKTWRDSNVFGKLASIFYDPYQDIIKDLKGEEYLGLISHGVDLWKKLTTPEQILDMINENNWGEGDHMNVHPNGGPTKFLKSKKKEFDDIIENHDRIVGRVAKL